MIAELPPPGSSGKKCNQQIFVAAVADDQDKILMLHTAAVIAFIFGA